MKKTDLINFVNNQLGYTKLKTDNTVYSNINRATPCWWLNISPSKFNNSLNIILIEKEELILLDNLPENICKQYKDHFRIRTDSRYYGKLDIEISSEKGDYLKETKGEGHFDFKPHINQRFKINF